KRHAKGGENESLLQDKPNHIPLMSAQRHPNSNLVRALSDRVTHHAVDPDRCQRQGYRGKDPKQRHVESLLAKRFRHHVAHAVDSRYGYLRIDGPELSLYLSEQCGPIGVAAYRKRHPSLPRLVLLLVRCVSSR